MAEKVKKLVKYGPAREYLRSGGLNASQDGVEKFQDAVEQAAKDIFEKASESAKGRSRKTISAEDIAA